LKTQTYYLERAAEMEQLAKDAVAEARRHSLIQAAEAFRSLAQTAATHAATSLEARRE
jgi:hypothetical protein